MTAQRTFAEYLRYGTNDFLADAYFQEWVRFEQPAVATFWQQFLEQHPEKEKEVQEAAALLRKLRFKTHTPDETRVQHLWQAIDAQTPQVPVRAISVQLKLKWLLVAASIILIVTLGIWQWSREQYVHLATLNSQISHIVLPDNSEVILNANSSIKYAKHFGLHNKRELWIQGEAFFTVKPAPDAAAFTVHTPDLDVLVTGTAFNVYTRHEQTRVVLNHGGVNIRFTETTRPVSKLRPGEMLAYHTGDDSLLQQVTDTLRYTSWKQQRFVFVNTPLQEVARVIEDFYGCKVIFKDPELTSYKTTADMEIPDISTLIGILSNALNIHITQDGNNLILQKKNT
ncbi:FecR family protein [Chitinophaga nivalis]|uniref:FecR domain-containing protein n=1 Tax=Chitinophaga nivalis TaxID=2991709 RepID=A0ABT3IGC7_9BACT|nr:FecR domain-containing protein [Chitinophaga nivalis]MCW3467288.1 FecR domain-containing protein [Chitinophaga nivalis]MCW3483020.1 FecR domain-containing protein [Chitinophaga nivalis]